MTAKERDLHGEILKRANDAAQADWQNRLDALEDLRFRANEGGNGQWDPEVLSERVDQGRPVITINLIPQYVRQVTNEARNNRLAIKVRPVDDDADPDTADVLEGIVRHIEDQSEAVSKAYIPALDNAATCGIGHFRVATDYRDDNTWEQDIFIRGINNALGVLWDPSAKDPTRMDARYCFVLEDMPKDEYEEKYPDAAVADFGVSNQGMQWRINDMVRIAEYWCKEPITRTLAKTQDGKVIDITDVPKEAVKFLPPHKTRKVETHKIVSYIVSGTEILSGPHEWAGHYLPIIPVIGEETYIGENRVRSGLVRGAKDPQRLYNLSRSNQADIVGSQPLSPFIATFKQIEKYLPIWRNANKRKTPYLPYDADPGANGPPKRQEPPQPSSGLAEEIAMASNEMRSTTGIYASGLGEHTPDAKSGRAIHALQKQGDMSTMHYGDNQALAVRHCGRVLVDLIPYYYDTERMVRLLNEDGTNRFEKINGLIQTQDGPMPVNDLSVGTYDVTVTTGPSYATKRQENVDMLMQLIQTVPESAPMMLDIITKNMDGQGMDEVSKRFRIAMLKAHPEFADPKDDEQPPPPSQGDKMNALMAQLEARTKEAEAREAEATADSAEMDAATKAVELDAMSQTHHAMTEAVVLKTLQDVITRGQAALNPAQPGPGAGNQPAPSTPQPAQPQQTAAQ